MSSQPAGDDPAYIVSNHILGRSELRFHSECVTESGALRFPEFKVGLISIEAWRPYYDYGAAAGVAVFPLEWDAAPDTWPDMPITLSRGSSYFQFALDGYNGWTYWPRVGCRMRLLDHARDIIVPETLTRVYRFTNKIKTSTRGGGNPPVYSETTVDGATHTFTITIPAGVYARGVAHFFTAPTTVDYTEPDPSIALPFEEIRSPVPPYSWVFWAAARRSEGLADGGIAPGTDTLFDCDGRQAQEVGTGALLSGFLAGDARFSEDTLISRVVATATRPYPGTTSLRWPCDC